MQLLELKINSLEKCFNSLTEEIDNNNYKTLDYTKSVNNNIITDNFLLEYTKTNNIINNIVLEMAELFENNSQDKVKIEKNCEFDGHCINCKNKINNFNYCFSNCTKCKYFRKVKEKETEDDLKKYYEEYITTKPKKELNKSKTINNNLIINNNITINNTTNYIQTKDWFFYVTISTHESNCNEKLRYIFTYLMCGASGKQLFPNEIKHSNAVSYTVCAAKYIINHDNNESILHGMLRYKYNNTTSMNIKRLEKMGDDKYIVKVYVPKLCNNNKSFVLKEDITSFIDNISISDNGSNINKFYIED